MLVGDAEASVSVSVSVSLPGQIMHMAQMAMCEGAKAAPDFRKLFEARSMLHYERWEVFRDLVELRDIAGRLATKYPRRGLGIELTQLVRSSSSAVLNLGEGAKHTKKGHKLERYGATLASIGECNANLVILATQLPREPLISRGRFLCGKTSKMMTNLIRTVERDWE